jgi:hypothetical protein
LTKAIFTTVYIVIKNDRKEDQNISTRKAYDDQHGWKKKEVQQLDEECVLR